MLYNKIKINYKKKIKPIKILNKSKNKIKKFSKVILIIP